MDSLKAPEALKLDGNLSENWRRWKQRFSLYLTATGVEKKDETIQVATLLHVIGPDALEVFNTFKFGDGEDKEKIKDVTDKFEAYCNPRKNVTYERHLFFTRCQQESETVDKYVTDLRNKSATCEFGELCDSLIRDRLVCGVRDKTVKDRLLRDSELTLKKAIDVCRASEVSKTQLKLLEDEEKPSHSVHAVKQKTRGARGGGFRARGGHSARGGYRAGTSSSWRSQNQKSVCQRCGYDHHPENRCPADGKTCAICSKVNHFAKMCLTGQTKVVNSDRVKPEQSQRGRQRFRRGKVHMVNDLDESDEDFHNLVNDMDESDEDFPLFVDVIGSERKNDKEKDWYIDLQTGNKTVKFKMDTGAQCNVMSKTDFLKIGGKLGRHKGKRLVTYTGEKIKTVGRATVTCEYKNKFYPLEFQVVDHEVTPVLGLQTCKEMNLIQRIELVQKTEPILEEFKDVFQGLGSFSKYHIEVDPTVRPVIHPPRRVPVALHDTVKTELDRMESLGVIEKVQEPTEWVNSMVIVNKPNGKIRICMDPLDLNRAIKREHHPMKTIDDVISKVAGAKYFTKLDAECGFWQIELDEASSKLCTFNTPFGRYKYLTLPFGISSAPEVFEKAMSEVYEGLEGVETIVDDILVWGETLEQHDARLRQVLEKARKHNLRLNKSKCQIALTEIQYIGHTLSDKGLSPDPEKIKAISEMPEPVDKPGLQRFMGMIQYVAKFIPNLSQISAPIRELLEKNVYWHWNERHRKCFSELQNLVTTAPVLKYYDVNQHVTLSVDASSTGLGAVILQNNQPVAYASKSLTSCQQRYAQIEKEMLAIVFGATRFHQYIFGQSVTVQTDHKPLEIIVRKPLHQAPLRLQRMLLKIQQYDLKVEYVPGKELHVADALSRAHLAEEASDLENELNVHLVLGVSENRMAEISRETEKDLTLRVTKSLILSGWPENRSDLPSQVPVELWNIRDELTIQDGVIFKGERPLIPSSMRVEMLEKIHESHLGVEKCRQRARDVIFWPGMSKDIQDLVSRCRICQEHRMSNTKEPLIPHEVPDRPWSKIATDIFHLEGESYLLLVDYYSEFFEISKLSDTKSDTVISHCKSQFARYGIPDLVISDNGPQYASSDFRKFAKSYGFTHKTSSPTFPQSNGMAEKSVQTAKRLLKKAKQSGSDPYLAILDYRNTPRSTAIGSPAQRLMGRRTRTSLPTSTNLLVPKIVTDVKDNLQKKRDIQKHYYDRGSKQLPPLELGNNVRIQRGKQWQPGRVIEIDSNPRSVVVQSNGTQYRRNRKHLNRTREQFTERDLNSCDDRELVDVNYDTPCSPPRGSRDTTDGDIPEPGVPQAVPTPVLRTSSGRVVKIPVKLNDYVRY